MNKRRRPALVLCAVAMATLLPALVGTSTAYAGAPLPSETEHISASELDVERGNSPTLSADEQALTEKYIEDQASIGRGLDPASVRIATTEVEDGTVGVIYEAGDQLNEIVVKDEAGEGTREGIGVALLSTGGAAAANSKAGNDAANATNAALRGRACRSLFFDAKNASQDHYIYDCWEKFQSTSRSQDWFYNRYTLFNPADSNLHYLNDATIRFKPWKGKESTVAGGPYSYSPANSSSSCKEYTASVTAGPASLSVPYTSCGSNVEPLPRSDTHAMGADWDGNTKDTIRLDAAATFTSNSTPVFADYVWQTTAGGAMGTRQTDNDSWRDSGF